MSDNKAKHLLSLLSHSLMNQKQAGILVLWRTFFIVLCSLLGLQLANAHPHVWIDAKAELVLDDEGNFVAIRHQWGFDEAFAAYATLGLDKNRDGHFSREELAKLARINVESIADFQYFTFIQMGDDKPDYKAGTDYWMEYEQGQLNLFYTLPLSEPITPDAITGFKDLTIQVYDPAFYANLAFSKDSPVSVVGPEDTKSTCTATVAKPRALDPMESQLLAEVGPAEDIPADLAPDIIYLSSTITVTCPST